MSSVSVLAFPATADVFTYCGNVCEENGGMLPMATAPCQIPQWNGTDWVATRSPGITEVTVGPTTGLYPDIATALTMGCRVIRVVDTYTDTSDWSLTNFPALAATPAILIYTDPGIILTLEPPDTIVIPPGFTVTWGGFALENTPGESTGSTFRLTSNSPSAFIANGGAFLADTCHIIHENGAPPFSADPDDTSGNLRFQNVGFTLASSSEFIGTLALPSQNLGAEFHQCKFLGQNALAGIIRSMSQRTVVITDSHIEGTFGGPPPVPPAMPNRVILLINDQHRLDGLTTRLDAGTSTTITLGGHIAGIENAHGSAFGELFLNPTGTRVSEVECAQLVLGSTATVNMIISDITLRDGNNLPSALSFDGRGKVFNNLDCGTLTVTNAGGEPGVQLSDFRVRGDLIVTGDRHHFSNGALGGPDTPLGTGNITWGATNSSLADCSCSLAMAVTTDENAFSNLNVGTSLTISGDNNTLTNSQTGAALTLSGNNNQINNVNTVGALTITGARNCLSNIQPGALTVSGSNTNISGVKRGTAASLSILITGTSLSGLQFSDIDLFGGTLSAAGGGTHTDWQFTNLRCGPLQFGITGLLSICQFTNCRVSDATNFLAGGGYTDIQFDNCYFTSATFDVASISFLRCSIRGCTFTGLARFTQAFTNGLDNLIIDNSNFGSGLTLNGAAADNLKILNSNITGILNLAMAGTSTGFMISGCVTTGTLDVDAIIADLQVNNCNIGGDIDIDVPGDIDRLQIQQCYVGMNVSLISTGHIDDSVLKDTRITDGTFTAILTITTGTFLRNFEMEGCSFRSSNTSLVTLGAASFRVRINDCLLSGITFDGPISAFQMGSTEVSGTLTFDNSGVAGLHSQCMLSDITCNIINWAGPATHIYRDWELTNLTDNANLQLGTFGAVAIENMNISNSDLRVIISLNASIDGLLVDNCTFSDIGIRLRDSNPKSNIRVSNCIMPAYEDTALAATDNVGISNCRFTNIVGIPESVSFGRAGFAKTGAVTNVSVSDCQLVGDMAVNTTAAVHGLSVQDNALVNIDLTIGADSSNWNISGTREPTTSTTGGALTVSGAFILTNAQIIGNIFNGDIDLSALTILSNGIVKGNTAEQILAGMTNQHVNIEGNKITPTVTTTGITVGTLAAAAASSFRVYIVNNILQPTAVIDSHINVFGGTGSNYQNVVVQGNYATHMRINIVQAQLLRYLLISNNLFTGTVATINPFDISNISIVNNHLGLRATVEDGDIDLSSVSSIVNCNISDNLSEGTNSGSILLSDQSNTNVVIDGNNLTNTTSSNIRLGVSGATNTDISISNNRIKDDILVTGTNLRVSISDNTAEDVTISLEILPMTNLKIQNCELTGGITVAGALALSDSSINGNTTTGGISTAANTGNTDCIFNNNIIGGILALAAAVVTCVASGNRIKGGGGAASITGPATGGLLTVGNLMAAPPTPGLPTALGSVGNNDPFP